MCGIIDYLGDRQATPILMESLKRLEYRGYDSAGVAVLEMPKVGSDGDKMTKFQEKWKETLTKFVTDHPSTDHPQADKATTPARPDGGGERTWWLLAAYACGSIPSRGRARRTCASCRCWCRPRVARQPTHRSARWHRCSRRKGRR